MIQLNWEDNKGVFDKEHNSKEFFFSNGGKTKTSVSVAEKMTEEQQFCLRWNDFQTNMVASFKHLRDEKSFCDVTIATEVK